MSARSLVFAGIAPHPPIMVPEVGGDSIAEVRGSIEGMRDFTLRLIDSGAETVVLISPHAPLEARAFVAYQDPNLHGDFSNFRAPNARVEARLDEAMLASISKAASDEGFQVKGIYDCDLDHGTSVPLYFLQANGWHGQVVAIGYSFLSNDDHLRFGSCIRRAADEQGRPVAFIASGDLSHRLKPEAPAGFYRDAHLFDQEIVEAIRSCAPQRIVDIDPDLRRLAGECGYRSMLVAVGVTGTVLHDCEVLNYEAPFGVGYLVAQLTSCAQPVVNKELHQVDSESEPREDSGEQLLALARRSVETFVREGRVIGDLHSEDAWLAQPSACFVSIKTDEGELRGCIGTIEPAKDTLIQELVANAVNSATRDPRFPPIAQDELSHLRYSVDVLSTPEPTKFEGLDPKVYGVIVEDEVGSRRGLLLPDLEGVETANQQVEIAARKAGISAGTPLKLFRFMVKRYREPTHVSQE